MLFLRLKSNRSNYWLAVYLSCLLWAPASVLAKAGKTAHPVKKVDVRPNTYDNDIWSFALESDAYRSTEYLSPTVDFSSRAGWDLQIAVYNIPIHGGGAQNYEWDSYLNLSKTIYVNDSFKTLIGTQNGTTLFSGHQQWHNFDYGLLIYQPVSFLNVHVGPYLADKALSTTTNVVGFTTGFHLELIKNTLSFQGDYFSGHSNVSGAIVNLFYQCLPKTQIYIGVGVPEANSGNEFYGIVGFSLASR